MRFKYIALIFFSIIFNGNSLLAANQQVTVGNTTGMVFNDLNGNGIRDAKEPGIGGVGVSNGLDVVTTDSEGRYTLEVTDDTIIFIIKPAGWMTRVNELNLPQFYYIHKPEGSGPLDHPGIAPTGPRPDSIDFALVKQDEPEQFDVLIFGDPQVSRQEELGYLAHDVVDEAAGVKTAFGISLGDIVGNNIGDFGRVNQIISALNRPWYNVPGNHDMNFDAVDDAGSLETYKSIYGPTCYSFNYADVHFIVLDTILAYKDENDAMKYREELEEKQIQFVKNDLALVDKDKLIVLLMHAPENSFSSGRRELFAVLQDYPHNFSMAGHVHRTESVFLGPEFNWHGKQPHHLYISGAVCGAWWMGTPDERGIPHSLMKNGVPNGYSVITFDHNQYTIRFQACGRPAEYQMSIWAPEVIQQEDCLNTEVLVNVFAVSNKAKVQMRMDETGSWVTMENIIRNDPYFLQMRQWEKENNFKRAYWSEEPAQSSHIWRATVPGDTSKGPHFIQVKAEDVFGRVYTGRRLIRIE
ncbi:MAG: calcineurin-like phosphoesterase C-terminal domain-containing protein [Sedimentisphaerales bacterium]|nr:calcineurin-like phosphoesterase C-terminal domain-containing protein [Sedimentisphaerales bacterium]